MPLRVAVVGTGGIAGRIYLPLLARRTDVTLRWIADIDPAARAAVSASYNVGTVFERLPAAGDWPVVDLAFVLTPFTVRGEVIGPLLDTGVPVFCEKPLSLQLEEVEQLARRAEQTGTPLMVSFNRRFTPVLRWAWDRAQAISGGIVRAHKLGLALDRRTLHAIDTLRWFCGDGNHREIVARVQGDTSGAVTGVAALIRFDTGRLGIFHTTATAGRWIEELEVTGDGRMLRVDVPNAATLTERGQETLYRPDATGWYLSGEERFGFAQQLDAVLAAVRGGAPPPIPVSEAVRSHQLAHAILAACGGASG
ncbi:MAG: Gfo/Idh/MocA family oxidoreductase [Chloroflexi bacterium]|nr:Gfo/Idh/MocA family oxidoreductase [Chloroflexota bacterium]